MLHGFERSCARLVTLLCSLPLVARACACVLPNLHEGASSSSANMHADMVSLIKRCAYISLNIEQRFRSGFTTVVNSSAARHHRRRYVYGRHICLLCRRPSFSSSQCHLLRNTAKGRFPRPHNLVLMTRITLLVFPPHSFPRLNGVSRGATIAPDPARRRRCRRLARAPLASGTINICNHKP